MGLRRILIASYHFPPDAAVGALRPARFARILAEFGCEPYVLTAVDGLRHQGVDTSRMTGLGTLPVTATGELPRVLEALLRILAAVGRGRSKQPDVSAGAEAAQEAVRETVGGRLKRYVVSLLLLLPDEKKNWSLRASVEGVRLIRRHDIGWLYTSGPPFSNHVIGITAKMFTTARWIADFRDPWIDMLPHRFAHLRSDVSDRIERWMERLVVTRADTVVTTTERMREAMMVRYPSIPPDRFVCIPNGIDAGRFSAEARPREDQPLTITYAGVLYFDRTPEPLFRALAELISSGGASPTQVRFRLVGDCERIACRETRDVIRQYGLEGVVELIGRVRYSEAVRLMQESHLVLVLAPERHRLVVPAKVFDYLGSGAALLVIAEPGATVDLVNETRSGRCFSERDVTGLREYLLHLLEHGRYRTLRNEPSSFSRYDVRQLAKQLVAEMTKVEASVTETALARS